MLMPRKVIFSDELIEIQDAIWFTIWLIITWKRLAKNIYIV